MPSLLSLVVFALLVSGCANPPSGAPGSSGGPSHPLSHYLGCYAFYPDNRSVDCARDDAQDAQGVAPADMRCQDKLSSPSFAASLWRGDGGRYGAQFEVLDRKFSESRFAGHASVFDGKNTAFALMRGEKGFVTLQGTAPNTDDNILWNLLLYEVNASGTPDFLGTKNLSLHLTRHGNTSWAIWSFQDGAAHYFFNSMVGVGDRWYLAAIQTSGPDFNLHARAATRIDGGSGFFYREPLPLDSRECG